MRIQRPLSHFLKNESGAVTVDYVVLTAAIVGIGLLMIDSVRPSAAAITSSAGARYAATRITVVNDAPVVDPNAPLEDVTVEIAL